MTGRVRRVVSIGACAGLLSIVPATGARALDCRGLVRVRSPRAGPQAQLLGVAAPSPDVGFAVGVIGFDLGSQSFAERWDAAARRWALVAVPHSTSTDALFDVDATSAADAWAVGDAVDNRLRERTLVEHWDGARWGIVPSPNVRGAVASALLGISALAPDDAWAVGLSSQTGGQPFAPMTMHWNGRGWKIVPTPPVYGSGQLRAVDAISKDDVWAVGDHGVDRSLTLTFHWDGMQWSAVSSSNHSATSNDALLDVSAVTGSDVWAVGSYAEPKDPNVGRQTSALHWDGSSWMVVETPNPAHHSELRGVSAAGTDDVWAVGVTDVTSTLAEHRTGGAWVVEPTPRLRGATARLSDVAALPGGRLWAVGAVLRQTNHGLIERRCG